MLELFNRALHFSRELRNLQTTIVHSHHEAKMEAIAREEGERTRKACSIYTQHLCLPNELEGASCGRQCRVCASCQ